MLLKRIIFLIAFISLFSAARSQKKTLHIMAYNIHHGCDIHETLQLNNIAALIKKSGAEIIGLEEVDSVCTRSGKTDQAKILGELTGMNYYFVRHFPYQGGAYGLALLSKYPVSTITNNRIPISATENGISSTAVLTAGIKINNKDSIKVLVAHLDYRSNASRIHQSKVIFNFINASKQPVILLGDMNATPKSETIQNLTHFFADANKQNYLTFPSDSAKTKIDYILIDKEHFVKTLAAPRFDSVQYSDHLPVLADVEIK